MIKNKRNSILFFILFTSCQPLFWAGIFSSHAEGLRTPECPPRTPFSEPILDPRAWALQCLGNSCEQDSVKTNQVIEFEADINQDQIPELFVSSTYSQGNAGGEYFVFRRNENHFYYLGSLFLHPKAFKVLPIDNDQQPKMVLYRRSGCCEGMLITVKYTGTRFAIIEQETIYPLDKDRERYRELFGD